MTTAPLGKVWYAALALASIVLCLFLIAHHAFAPMWLEGFGETVGEQLVLLGFDGHQPHCWLRVGKHSLPLALNSYTGLAWYYVQAPTVYLWFAGYTSDLYFYRYTTILIFLTNGWLLLGLLSRFYSGALAFLATLVFMTTPILLIGALTEHGVQQLTLLFPLLAGLLLSLYLTSGRLLFLIAGCFSLGLALLTRLESFFWLVVPIALFILLVRRPLLLSRWKAQPHKLPVALAATGAFILGMTPLIAYNFLCPTESVLSFLKGRVIPRTLDTTTLAFPAKLAARLEQFWSFDLLNRWRLWELHTPNYVLAILVLFSAGALVLRWGRGDGASPTLLALASLLPLSIIVPGPLREEHLIVLMPLLPPLILSGLLYLSARTGLKSLPALALAGVVLTNAATSSADWRYWTRIPATRQTMLNQADPNLLANYLVTHHRGDRVLYTNIGMPQYVQYVTAGRLRGEDISSWGSVNGFADALRLALLDKASRRVLVAVGGERDGGADFVLSRTRLLYELLAAYHVPYKATRLRSPRNPYLYDIVVLERGQGLDGRTPAAQLFTVSNVLDVRIATDGRGHRSVIGSVRGAGFQRNDAVLIDGQGVPTFFGNEGWLSFSAPIEVLGPAPRSFRIEVVRPNGVLRSRAFPVRLPALAGSDSRR